MKKITVILPIHKLDEDYKEMLLNSVKSVEQFYEDVKLLIVHPEGITDELNVTLLPLTQKLEIKRHSHNGDTSFQSQINLGINNCDTEWFSILEVDDEYRPVWLKSMNEYIKTYTDVDVFLPIVKEINVEGKLVGFTNETNWVYGFTDRQGYMDNEVLLEFQNYQTSGGLFRTKVIKDNGGFKENIKLTFIYELLLRLTYNGVKILTVPKFGYQHVMLREDSLLWNYQNNESVKLSEKEIKFWYETAKKEFFFKNNRDINYVES